MLHDSRSIIIFIFVLVKLSASLIASEELSSLSLTSKKSTHHRKREKTKDHDFNCKLDLMPEQEELLFAPPPESSFDAATGAIDVPTKSNFVNYHGKAFDLYLWPKTKEGFVVVPYAISRGSKFSPDHLTLIRDAMDGIERETCIRFLPRDDEDDFLAISHGKFCKSNLGRTGGAQPLLLNRKDCFEEGIIMHELLHALGYIHTHSRPDRDRYVKVLWKNIDPKFRREFNQVSPTVFNNYGTRYDYFSVMHYGPTAFTRNGERTIATKDSSFQTAIGQRRGLSDGDVKRINAKYKCKKASWRLRLIKKWYDGIDF